MLVSKLITLFFSLGVALACLMVDTKLSFAQENLHDFTVDFSSGASLSDEELESIVELVFVEGVDEISSIRTVHRTEGRTMSRPQENEHMVIVREKPIDNGPYPSYRVLSVMGLSLLTEKNQAWYSKATYNNQRDGFWIQSIHEVTYFPTEFNGKNVEINVDERISRDDLERVVNALKNDRIEPIVEYATFTWSSTDRGLPVVIQSGKYSKDFGRTGFQLVYGDSFSSDIYLVVLEQDKLVIISVRHTIS